MDPFAALAPGELRTERLRLVPVEPVLAPRLHPVLDDPALHTWTGGAPLGLDALTARYGRLASRRSPDGTQAWLSWAVLRGEAAVGTVEATVLVRDHPVAVLAWVISSGTQGRGYAGEAATAVRDWLAAHGVMHYQASIAPGHAASEAVARRIGLAPTGARTAEGERVWSGRAGG